METFKSNVCVVNENTLCVMSQSGEWADFAQPLACSLIRGGHNPMNGNFHASPLCEKREATIADFKEYRVSNPELYGIEK